MSEVKNPTVFVCGATGSQGGALARQLRELNWGVHTTARNLGTPAVQSLQAAGVNVFQGDWDDNDSIASAMAGCDKLFLCLMPDFKDMSREPRQAGCIVKIAKAAGVRQVVASTTLGIFMLDEPKGDITVDSLMAQHLGNKKAIEEVVRNGGFDYWSFLRPSFLMANFVEPGKVERYPEPRDKGTWLTAMVPDAQLALLDHVDIAAFAVEMFKQPRRFHDQAIGMVSDYKTVQETLDLLGKVAGRSFKALFMTDEEIAEKRKTSNVFINSQVATRYMPRYMDIDFIRTCIRTTSFEEYLERESANVKRTYA